ncbi:MAG TPA: autotransporter domain-containing protein, partial [Xanthomonadales bacterium]|nr:autotransporter domain-containing protein [Xanthomonadales bacterium]
VDQGNGQYDAFSTARLVLGDDPSQTIVVEAQSPTCSSQGAGPAQFFEFINAPPQPRELVAIAGNGVTGSVGDAVPIAVRALDPCGGLSRPNGPNGGAECPIDIGFSIVAGSAQFRDGTRNTTVRTDSSDTSRVDLVLGPQPGPITVRASASGYAPIDLALRATAQRTLVAVGGATRSGAPGTTGELEVQLLENGQPVANEMIVFQNTFGQVAVLSAASDITDASGFAKVAFTFAAQPSSGLVDARAPGGENVVFSVTSQLGGLALVAGDGQTGPTNGEPADPFVFVLQDQSGNPLSGETVSFSVASGSGTVNPATATTDSVGRVQTRLRFGAVPGSVTVQASAFNGQALAAGAASSFVPVLTSTSGNNQTAPAGTRLPLPLVVQIGQPPIAGKSLGGVPVNWTVTAGGGTLAAATTFTDASGRASNELTLGPQAGTNTVQASVVGDGSATFTATATASGGAGVTLQVVSGNNQSLPTFTDSAPLVVRAVNAQGAPVANVRVVWTPVVSGAVAVNPTTSTTDSGGQASTVARVQLPGAQEVAAQIEGAPASSGVRFTLNGGVQNVPALDEGEASVGGAIDAACPALFAQSQGGSLDAGEADLLQRCSELVVASGSDPGSVQEALDQMVADEALAQGTAAITTTAAQFDNLKARLAALRSGSRGMDIGGLALAGGNGAMPLSFLPSNLLMQDDTGSGSDEAGAGFSRWGFFATGTIGRGNQDAVESSPGFDFDTYGLTAGVDYRVNDDFVIGAALGYNNNDTQIDGDQGGLDTKGWNLSGYGSWYHDAWYLDGVLTWGNNDYDVTRRIRYTIAGLAGGSTTVDQVATASPGSDQLAFALSVGRDFNRGAWSFGPYARATYTSLDFDGYTERLSDPDGPGGGLAVVVDSRELTSLEGVVGGKATYTSSRSWGILMPYVQVEWLHEFEDDIENLVSRFANDPTGTAIVVPGEPIDQDYFNLGLGLSAVFANGRSGFIYYEHRAGQENFSQDSLAIGVRIEF